jgi:ADP-ribose pyrophosphatase YjhB (NUDIX family)
MRNDIRQEIQLIQPLDDLEREHRQQALDWVDSGAELCRIAKPATPPMHLVSYFVVVDGDHALLVDHKNAGLWLPPGGHVESGEHPRDTVVREVHEELGFTPTHNIEPPLMITCTTTVGLTAGHTDVSLWYVVNTSQRQNMTFDADEFHGVKWFAFDEVPFERAEPHLKRFIRKLASNFVGHN